MLKLLRLLFLLLPASVGIAQSTGEVGFDRQFGEPGAPGSFHAYFSRLGGGLKGLQLTDHYKSVAAARNSPHTPADYMLLTFAPNGDDHGLRLVGTPAETHFEQDLATAEWTYQERDSGVVFSIDSGKGLVLEKNLTHDPTQRGFRLEFVLRNRDAEPGGQVVFTLLGPALVNAPEVSLLGTSSVAIADSGDGAPKHVGPAPGKVQPLDVDLKNLSFAGNTNRFFGAFLYPLDDASRAALVGVAADTVPAREDPDSKTPPNSVARARYTMSLAIPARDAETRVSFGLYLGPKSYHVFEKLANPERFAPILNVDLTTPCCFVEVPGGRFMARVLLRLLGWFHDVIGNWGFAIIMLTLLVRGLLAPVNYHMQKSMRAYGARMAVLKPKLDALKAKYGDDQKAYQQAMVAFQREHKMIPPIGGCLPLFATMPIYIGLFTALRTAYDLRHQSFGLWIQDLSRADALFHLSFWPHEFNLLPLLWISMFVWLQLRMPLPTDPQARQMQKMMRYMPILFGVMLYGYASALLVYMVTSMVWSMLESAIMKRLLGPIDPNVAAMAPTPM